MAEDKKVAAGAPGKESAGGGKKFDFMMIIKLALVLLNFGAISGGSYLVYASTLGWDGPRITEELEIGKLKVKLKEDAPPLIFTMDKFTVNLGGEPKRIIQVEINLQMLSEIGYEEVMNPEKTAMARDKVLGLLNQKDFAALESLQGKLFLKDEIARSINSVLNKGIVKDVYFSAFVVQ